MFAVMAFAPSGSILHIRGKFRTHRDARKHMLKREGELKSRFGFLLFIAGE